MLENVQHRAKRLVPH